MRNHWVLLLGLSASVGACAKNSGIVEGLADTHCDGVPTPTVGTCNTSSQGDNTPAAASAKVLYGAEAEDDDCKYHLKWSADDVAQGQDVTFTLTATVRSTGKPATAAAPRIEALLDELHPAPPTAQKAKETSPGVYTIGPVRFDAKGQWTVRYHLYGQCVDQPDQATGAASPHGHAAFYVRVL